MLMCLYTFAHASVLMTEDCGMQDALCTAFFHRFQSVALIFPYTPVQKFSSSHPRMWDGRWLRYSVPSQRSVNGPLFTLKFTLWNKLPSSWQTGGRRHFEFPLLTEGYVYGIFLKFQHTFWEMRAYSWVTTLDRCCLPTTETWLWLLLR